MRQARRKVPFAGEDDTATSPKFDVTDAWGVVWKVKLGDESQAETAATGSSGRLDISSMKSST
jgi:hypothetical protein